MARLTWILFWASGAANVILQCALPSSVLAFAPQPQRRTSSSIIVKAALSEADKDRLLLGEVGLTAFISAEVRHFVNQTMQEHDLRLVYAHKWTMSLQERQARGLVDTDGKVVNEEYQHATNEFAARGDQAVELIVETTEQAFRQGWQETGLLSALGSAISFFRQYYFETPTLIAACERVGLNDYAIAHHITDMYHHRTFRGAYTKTLAPSGEGEIAAKIAVGMLLTGDSTKTSLVDDEEEQDECLVWSPITPGVCLHWKSDDDAWRKKRFERIQMEGTRDPRRGGSGTTR